VTRDPEASGLANTPSFVSFLSTTTRKPALSAGRDRAGSFVEEFVEGRGGGFNVGRSSDHANLAQILPHVELVVVMRHMVRMIAIEVLSSATWEDLIYGHLQNII
jgi:hypothetical protein